MQVLEGANVEDCDLEPAAPKARLAGRAFICSQRNSCELLSLSQAHELVVHVPVHSTIQEQQVLSKWSFTEQVLKRV